MDATASDGVDRIARVQATQFARDAVEVVLNSVCGQCPAQERCDMGGQSSVSTTEQHRRVEAAPTVAVHGDDDVDMIDELAEPG